MTFFAPNCIGDRKTGIDSRRFLTLLLLVAALSVSACRSSYQVTNDAAGGDKKVVTGTLSWQEWKSAANWQSYDAPDYAPDTATVKTLVPPASAGDVRYTVIGGAWCGDSKSEMPKVYKLFAALGVPPEKITLIGVDRQKKEPSGNAGKFSVQRVPTLVVMKGGGELGRIVEFPKESWEKDLLKLFAPNAAQEPQR